MSDITDPTHNEYRVKCRVQIVNIQTRDLGQVFERTMVYLIPDYTTTSGVKFLNAWLPETETEFYEIAMEVGKPINGPSRGAIRRRNEKCQHHHVVVMIEQDAKDFIKEDWDGKNVEVNFLSALNENIADGARDSDGNYDVVE